MHRRRWPGAGSPQRAGVRRGTGHLHVVQPLRRDVRAQRPGLEDPRNRADRAHRAQRPGPLHRRHDGLRHAHPCAGDRNRQRWRARGGAAADRRRPCAVQPADVVDRDRRGRDPAGRPAGDRGRPHRAGADRPVHAPDRVDRGSSRADRARAPPGRGRRRARAAGPHLQSDARRAGSLGAGAAPAGRRRLPRAAHADCVDPSQPAADARGGPPSRGRPRGTARGRDRGARRANRAGRRHRRARAGRPAQRGARRRPGGFDRLRRDRARCAAGRRR